MDENFIRQLARELAQKVNKMINIPLLKEEDEEAFFYFIILNVIYIIIGMVTKELDKL